MPHPSRIWLLAIGGSVAAHVAALAAVGWLASLNGASAPGIALRQGGVAGVRVTLVHSDRDPIDASPATAQAAASREQQAQDSIRPVAQAANSDRASRPTTPPLQSIAIRVDPAIAASATAGEIQPLSTSDWASDAPDASMSPSQSSIASRLAMLEPTHVEVGADLRAMIGGMVAAGASIEGVDHQPVPHASNRSPAYPVEARRRHEAGTVILHVVVESDGRVSAVEVATSSGSVCLDDSAAQVVRTWRFAPAQRGGSPMRCEIMLPVQFILRV